MTREQAIMEVCRSWGVNAETKVKAIWLLMNGCSPQKVAELISDISNSLGGLKTMEEQTKEKNAAKARSQLVG